MRLHNEPKECEWCGADLLNEDDSCCSQECYEQYEHYYWTRVAWKRASKIEAKLPGFFNTAIKEIKSPYKEAIWQVMYAPGKRSIKRLKGGYRLYPALLDRGVQPYKMKYDYGMEWRLLVNALREAFGWQVEIKQDPKFKNPRERIYVRINRLDFISLDVTMRKFFEIVIFE